MALPWETAAVGNSSHAKKRRGISAVLFAAVIGGCAYNGLGPVDEHYENFKARMPEHDSIFVCSAYGCRTQTRFRFTPSDIATLENMMAPSHTKTAPDEREVARATLAWMERRVGDVVGTSADRPGDDLAGNGDPTQMDCVDVATNMTSYLLILERHRLLRHHTVGAVYSKEDLRRGLSGWLHYAAILVENQTGQRFAVDGWLLASGKPPEIIEAEKWYIDNSNLLFSNAAPITPRIQTGR